MSLKDLEKEFIEQNYNDTHTCTIELALAYARTAIQKAFEETRVEVSKKPFTLNKSEELYNTGMEKGVEQTLSEVAKRQANYLNQ